MSKIPKIPKRKVNSHIGGPINSNGALGMVSPNTYLQQGIAFHKTGDFTNAKLHYLNALKLNPHFSEAIQLLGVIEHQLSNYALAIELISKAIEINPTNAIFYSNRGNSYRAIKQFENAIKNYERAIELNPDYADAHYNLGLCNQVFGKIADAVSGYKCAIAINPAHMDAYYNLGLAHQELKQSKDAIVCYTKVISIKGSFVEVLFNRANAYKDLLMHEEAISDYQKAIEMRPDFLAAYNNYGNALINIKKYEAAKKMYEKAIELQPDYADAFHNLGNAFKGLKQLDQALASVERAIAIKPSYAEAYNTHGSVLRAKRRIADAIKSFEKAISIKPNFEEAYNNLGNAQKEVKMLDAAMASYQKAISIKPHFAEAYNNLGNTQKELKMLEAAITSFEKVFAINPEYEHLLGLLVHLKMQIGDWSQFEFHKAELSKRICDRKKVANPFAIHALIDSPELQKLCAESYIEEAYAYNDSLGPLLKKDPNKKIRVAYFSGDFRNHPVSFLTAELFELHDKTQFETYAFSFGNNKEDEMRTRLKCSFDHFIDIDERDDREAAKLARDLSIDIAVDLGGFTAGTRTGIFAFRVAPIQLSYIGYLGTMGADYMDYLIADKTIIPTHSQAFYSEKIIYLPSYQANDSKREISEKVFSRQELGLPEKGFVFCCFNNNYKILPSTFCGWMRILNAVKGSCLFLYGDNNIIEKNLKLNAEKMGISQDRIVFGGRISREEYLARYRSCDLFLDTTPYNAGTTASDALWAGLSVLTLMGESFASRVAASLLNAIDLPELITTSQDQYEALAIRLATHPEELGNIKNKLSKNRLSTPLFDTPLFTKHLETAYLKMMERYWGGLAPEHIVIPN